MPGFPSTAPVLSTPDTHIFEAATDTALEKRQTIPEEDFAAKYEIARTASEIKAGRWRVVALQFPDSLISDAPRVVEGLRQELKSRVLDGSSDSNGQTNNSESLETSFNDLHLSKEDSQQEKLYILGDTSYGACCVDEVAAEHIDAEVVVHYGRACLSPTSRLPVIYVFTEQPLSHSDLVRSFKETYPDHSTQIILMADVTYSSHIPDLASLLAQEGYTSFFAPTILHDPSSPLPNRTVPSKVASDPSTLQSYHLFHISDPPPALLLTLSSRVASIHIYPTTTATTTASTSNQSAPSALEASTALSLRRRYALLTSLSTCSVFGILVTTHSVKNYLPAIARLQSLFASNGKKSYLFVVGKVNAAKLANFAEIGGWVVVGCWESSLVEGEGFWRPVITPFEAEVLLKGDRGRVWTGEWIGGFEGLLEDKEGKSGEREDDEVVKENQRIDNGEGVSGELDSEEESEPPEFDLRTGRYVANTRPMAPRGGAGGGGPGNGATAGSNQMIKRANGNLAVIGNQVSPGAEFLRSQRTWRGLGSDMEIAYDEDRNEAGTAIEEGRSGIARGYANEDPCRQ